MTILLQSTDAHSKPISKGVGGRRRRGIVAGLIALALAGTAAVVATAPASAATVGGVGATLPTKLTVRTGDITVTQAGTVLSGLEIRGRVLVRANNVTIRDCKIVGGAALKSDGALIQNWNGNTGLVVQNTVLRATNPSAYVNGIAGAGFKADKVTISNVIDGIVVIGNNVTVSNSVIGPTYHLAQDPRWKGGPSHDDGIQIEGGGNIIIENNTIHGSVNTAIMVTQNAGITRSMAIRDNSLAGGACTVNMDEKGKGAMRDVYIYRNVFGQSSYGWVCSMRIPKTTAAISTIFSNTRTTGAAASQVLF